MQSDETYLLVLSEDSGATFTKRMFIFLRKTIINTVRINYEH